MEQVIIMKVKIKTITPLWTGGINGSCDRIHETGIIGSMRWWYEAIVRGLGGDACDPSQHECPDKDGYYCDSCAIFGTTGLKRSFRIDLPIIENPNNKEQLTIKVCNNRGWYLKRGLFENEVEGYLISGRLSNWTEWEDVSQFLALALRLASEWGGLGARTQQGYGVAKVETDPVLNINKALLFNGDLNQRPSQRTNTGQELPRFDEFFFARIRFYSEDPWTFIKNNTTKIIPLEEFQYYQDTGIVPISSLVRYYLRKLIRQEIGHKSKSNSVARWRLMGVLSGRYHNGDFGKVKAIEWRCQKCGGLWDHKPTRNEHLNCRGRAAEWIWQCENCEREWGKFYLMNKETSTIERCKSLIQVSHAYCVGENLYEFRIWGWIPQVLPGSLKREDVLDKLIEWLGVETRDLREWQDAYVGKLWDASLVNLQQPQVLCFDKKESETSEDYLRALSNSGGKL
ncbi:type III-B CRISPR module RAMP protein Cmr1 [Candidatus Methanocrinis natronophilus]|uniref:Type III-B CRISPR module RAMP protein Cmr1 n=1 Tax=Candidatus Methanocrinis natronophilus TaxID=3033396 RepID=A0ABT5X8E9_9EURY|nr:type III-B CRISPR module RAMP protein Cmr1 [Candidatus Methanocrinis natronophilus]MDF0590974.1 type III-B CRISPR module RAMP protein Cmr1 [Candidatus Methanocrinis natronophilus]